MVVPPFGHFFAQKAKRQSGIAPLFSALGLDRMQNLYVGIVELVRKYLGTKATEA